MGATDRLDQLRGEFPSCEFIAFIDLSCDMVLAKSAAKRMLQERWDLLCAMVRDGMTSPDADLMQFAALLNADECDVFLRSDTAPDYVICAVGQPDLPVAAFYSAAKPVLERLVQDD